MSGDKITVGRYLFKRLHELGVRGVHGVPGDFNLATLDILPEAGLEWVGNCNELNAGYAADGYARVKGISALVTTFGVGELSAIAAVAGAYSEHVPLVHVVGVPNTAAQKNGLLLHHTLGNGDFQAFEEMYRKITVSSTHLRDPARAAEDIDRVLETCYIESRPVYIALPTDVALTEIHSEPLKKKLRTEVKDNNQEYEEEVISEILKMIYSSKDTVILVDACAIRHRVLEELHKLVKTTGFTTFVTPMGKGAVSENLPEFGGVYIGDASRPEVQKRMEQAECVLYVGGLQSDFNTAGFTFRITAAKTVEFHSDHMKIRNATYPFMHMKPLMRTLLPRIEKSKIPPQPSTKSVTNEKPSPPANPQEDPNNGTEITHAYLWPKFGNYLKEDDIVCTETGTANFGIIESVFPAGVTLLSQVLWGSIGYSVGCCQGAALAAKELWEEGGKVITTGPEKAHVKNRRVILWVGDGSLQLTAQEISTMIRLGLSPTIFVINNNGYTIERRIHGLHEKYNDIQPWNLKHLLPLFSPEEGKSKYLSCKDRKELEHVLFDEGEDTLNDGKEGVIKLVEVFMPQMDVPRALGMTADATAKLNKRMLGK
ncbi:pyruvate decarboxylase [Ascobolus immersus RN42]|uniref:Pyruvate decarboxylase n=1 Tax=Ascobolus immersus RN42 TaxID=1160509 RepID=A0A3N4I008_ASCIM|nr:pyruvate decarboxylase [Ascobolus immersus RN42]